MRISTDPKVHVKRTLNLILLIVWRKVLWLKQDVNHIGIDLLWKIYRFVKALQLCSNTMT